MRIHELPLDVINQIAAGEVVERPAHLVKELVENALDAMATEIDIQISDGGRNVVVRDNGVGIRREDLPLSLHRHATSKISNSLDLWNLTTFGFRGEALASIGAVSHLTITSRTADSDVASQIRSEFGKQSPVDEVGGHRGTTVEVRELFSNVPVRLRFLKSEIAEVTQIKHTLKALGLRNPQVQFRLEVNEKPAFFWLKESPIDRVKRILDLKDLHHGQHVDDEMKVEVFLAPPNITSATQRNIWSFVQGRPVYDRMLQAAVMDAYRGLLMHGEFPIAVVMVQTAPEDVDVNVHPTKSQVKFLESSKVFRAVQRTVREVLEPAPWVPSQPPQQARWVEEPVPLQTELSFSPSAAMAAPERSVFAEIPRPVLPAQPAATQPSKGWASLQLVGQTRLTYLVAQTADKLVLVDQHAAHERVLFEKLMAAWAGGNLDIQKYLIPLTMDLDANECAALMNAQKDLTKFGIAVEALSPTCLTISSGPSVLTDGALFKGLARLAQESAERGESYAIETAIGEVCATMACHSAVRAGQKLSLEQMVELLESMDQYSFSSFCPHGRPVWVEWEYSAIEREFGRIP